MEPRDDGSRAARDGAYAPDASATSRPVLPADAETQALSALADTVVRALPVEEVLARVVDEVARLLGPRAVWIYLLDDVANRLVVRAVRPTDLAPADVRPGDGLVWDAFEHQRLTLVADAGRNPRMPNGAACAATGIASAVLVPLVAAGRGIGVLVFCLPERTDAPDAHRFAMLTLFAAHAAVAIQSAAARAEAVTARAQAERAARRLGAIQRLEEAVALVPDLPSLLGRAASLAAAALGGRRGAVALVEWPERDRRRATGRVVFGTATEVWADLPWRSLPLGRHADLLALLEARRRAIVLDRPGDDPRLGRLRPFLTRAGTAQLILAPVISSGRLLGALAVDDGGRVSDGARTPFGPDDLSLLESLAARLGSAVDRVRLVESERRRSRELLALQRATQHLASAVTRATLVPLVVEEAARLLEADAALLRLRAGDHLVLAAQTASFAATRPPDRVAIDESLAGLAVRRNTPVMIRELARDPRARSRRLWQQHGFRSYLGVPIRGDGQVTGALGFYSRRPRRFEARDTELARTFADVVAVALENAHLFERVSLAVREWEASFNAMQDGVALLDREGRIVRANGALGRLLGRPVAELVGRPLAEVAPGLTPETEWTNGGRTLTLTVSSLVDDAGRPLGAVQAVRDVTGERRLQEQLIQSEKLASVGQLISGVAHELNNPLAAILGYSELLERRLTEPDLARDVAQVRLQTERASRIVHNLLAFARKHTPEMRRLSLNEVVEAALELQGYDLKMSGIEVEAALEPHLPDVMADFHQMEDVVVNVLVNAKQAILTERTEGGRIRAETRASRTDGGEEAVRLTIRDNGSGIAREHLHRIFDPFFTTKPVGVGTGLGLSICFGVVRSHGGRIWAESEPGAGTSIVVELPAAGTGRAETEAAATPEATESAAGPLTPVIPPGVLEGAAGRPPRAPLPASQAAAPRPHPARPPGSPTRVLVVDDEEAIRDVISSMLGLDGYEVETAEDGIAAAAHLAAEPFDLVLADIRMPGMGGLELADWIAAHRPALFDRVVFMTGDTLGVSTGTLVEATDRPCLTKPFTRDDLKTALERVLDHAGTLAVQ